MIKEADKAAILRKVRKALGYKARSTMLGGAALGALKGGALGGAAGGAAGAVGMPTFIRTLGVPSADTAIEAMMGAGGGAIGGAGLGALAGAARGAGKGGRAVKHNRALLKKHLLLGGGGAAALGGSAALGRSTKSKKKEASLQKIRKALGYKARSTMLGGAAKGALKGGALGGAAAGAAGAAGGAGYFGAFAHGLDGIADIGDLAVTGGLLGGIGGGALGTLAGGIKGAGEGGRAVKHNRALLKKHLLLGGGGAAALGGSAALGRASKGKKKEAKGDYSESHAGTGAMIGTLGGPLGAGLGGAIGAKKGDRMSGFGRGLGGSLLGGAAGGMAGRLSGVVMKQALRDPRKRAALQALLTATGAATGSAAGAGYFGSNLDKRRRRRDVEAKSKEAGVGSMLVRGAKRLVKGLSRKRSIHYSTKHISSPKKFKLSDKDRQSVMLAKSRSRLRKSKTFKGKPGSSKNPWVMGDGGGMRQRGPGHSRKKLMSMLDTPSNRRGLGVPSKKNSRAWS